MHYLFGNGDLAAQRLKVLSEVFTVSTKDFLLEAVAVRPHLALDLGCGPGYSTHLLSCVVQPAHAVGLDNSQHFISLAQQTQTESVSFRVHDVTSVPFPIGPADLLSCRFLLTHMSEPEAVIASWATQVRPKGILLMEEVEFIRTGNAIFSTYLAIVEALLADQHSKLYAGALLQNFQNVGALHKRLSKLACLPVPNSRAATMFFLNLQHWKQHAFIHANYASRKIARLENDLRGLTADASGRTDIEWGLRQLVFERV